MKCKYFPLFTHGFHGESQDQCLATYLWFYTLLAAATCATASRGLKRDSRFVYTCIPYRMMSPFLQRLFCSLYKPFNYLLNDNCHATSYDYSSNGLGCNVERLQKHLKSTNSNTGPWLKPNRFWIP